MIEQSRKNLIKLKNEFAKNNKKNQIQEIIPKSKSQAFPIPLKDLKLLHQFAEKNPIYYNSYELKINDIDCVIYEGDINKYWLNSIQHDSSDAPFSPTWIMSAYIGVSYAKELGYKEIIDVGSGDGRIAFCAKILNLESYSIEIDDMLVDLQKSLTILDFHPCCSDASAFDYSALNLSRPIFFIGGLAQMGGTNLADSILSEIDSKIEPGFGLALAGTLSPKYAPDPMGDAGWGTLIKNYNLKKIKTITLPTVWTFQEPDDTPYIFVKSSQ